MKVGDVLYVDPGCWLFVNHSNDMFIQINNRKVKFIYLKSGWNGSAERNIRLGTFIFCRKYLIER